MSMNLTDWLTLFNILLLVVNILGLVYQFFPRIYICKYTILDKKANKFDTYLSISNNSLLGVYIDKISYNYNNRDLHNCDNLGLEDFRLFGNSDYAILLSEPNCSITLELKHSCLINGGFHKKYKLKDKDNLPLRNHSLSQGHIIIDKGL